MGRTVFVNGEYLDEQDAKVSLFDRGFLFSDSVYEVTAVINQKLVSWKGHIRRLRRSLKELEIALKISDDYILDIHRKLLDLNNLKEGLVYLQITRGVADRDFSFPDPVVEPTVVLFTQERELINNKKIKLGTKVLSFPDLRWGRSDIKSTQLLYASMSKQRALDQGKDEAWFVRDELVTEGSSNNAFIISKDRKIKTRSLTRDVLAGITRESVIKYAKNRGYIFEEKPFSLEEAKDSLEAFTSSATTFIMPVVEIDGFKVGSGLPGKITMELRKLYIENIIKELV